MRSETLATRSTMQPSTHNMPPTPSAHSKDEYLFGWDPTPGIVSIWASREGQAVLWRREVREHTQAPSSLVTCTVERFTPWLFATTLDDLAHLGPVLQPLTP